MKNLKLKSIFIGILSVILASCGGRCDHNFEVISETKATCIDEGTITKKCSKCNETIVEKTNKSKHTTDIGRCEVCGNLINDLEFVEETQEVYTIGGGYPRLEALKNNNWLLGYDRNVIYVRVSEDEGLSWSKPVIASFHPDAKCANVDFFEKEENEILLTYRALFDSGRRAIFSSISYDGGYTWEEYSTVVDNYDMGYTVQEANESTFKDGYNVGFYEPYVDLINEKITCMYADDFSPMIEDVRGSSSDNYQCQYLCTKELIDDEWVNRKVIVNGAEDKSPTGSGVEPRYSRDGMPVFAQMHNGTYVTVFEGTYRNTPKWNQVNWAILITYSKDGINWSNPTEVFIPKGYGTKASAPFILVTSDDRIVISFQTDEDCFETQYELGDRYSIMKCMISDGTKIENLNCDHFYPAKDVYSLGAGNTSVWNGMMYYNDTIYCISEVNGKITMNYSELPLKV